MITGLSNGDDFEVGTVEIGRHWEYKLEAKMTSLTSPTADPLDLAARRQRAREDGEFADLWLKERASLIESLPPRTVVIIHIPSGEYLIAQTSLEALDLFEARFGLNERGYMHEVGHTIFVGGGLWQL